MVAKFDSGRVSLKSLIAHRIPKHMKGTEGVAPELSEALPEIPGQTLAFFDRRLKATLTRRGQAVEPDTRQDNATMPPLVRSYLAEDVQLVPMSQQAAQHLFDMSGGSASEGLLMVADATYDGRPAVAVMKLDEEEGVQLEPETVGGLLTLNVTVLDNLLLTENTKVFKAGLFWEENGALHGRVSDEQQGERVDIAHYFLRRFLGCRLARTPGVLTKLFCDTVTAFINTKVDNQEHKLHYVEALQAELRSNKSLLDPFEFARDHLHDADRNELLDALKERHVPEQPFRKSDGNLGTTMKTQRLRTSSGITIAGKPEEIEQRVHTENQKIVIDDVLVRVT